MKVLLVAPNAEPRIVEIDGSLASMQSLVGGLIEAVYPFEDPVALICNGEGKLTGLPQNRPLKHPETGEIYDIVCGTFSCAPRRPTARTSSLCRRNSSKNIPSSLPCRSSSARTAARNTAKTSYFRLTVSFFVRTVWKTKRSSVPAAEIASGEAMMQVTKAFHSVKIVSTATMSAARPVMS